MSEENLTSKPLAPEDIRAGDYISLLHVVSEYLPFFCLEDVDFRRVEPVRIIHMPLSSPPLEVVEICLPFVLVRRPDESHATLDVRRHRFARLSKRFGRKAFKRLGAQESTKLRFDQCE